MDSLSFLFFFFFNDTAPTEIYTLPLHDALPIYDGPETVDPPVVVEILLGEVFVESVRSHRKDRDRKSTRLNSSHSQISYAVFCLKKKKKSNRIRTMQAPRRRPNDTKNAQAGSRS